MARRWLTKAKEPAQAAAVTGQRDSVRMLLSSTRFISSIFWLTIIVATMVFVLPYSEQSRTPVFYGFVVFSALVFLGHRYFPYEGYHPVAFFLLMLSTDILIASMVYMTGGSESSISLLFMAVIIFSAAYFELLETMLITTVTCAMYFAPVTYELISVETLKSMTMAVPIFMIIALGVTFVINKAREQEREKQTLTSLYDRADTKRREMSALYAVSLRLASTLDEEEMISILIENTCKLVDNDAVVVATFDPGGVLGVRASRGVSGEEADKLLSRYGENPLFLSASAVFPVVLRDAREEPRFQAYVEGTGFASMVAVPLFASASVVGVLCCFSGSEGAFDDDAVRLLLTLSSEVALALEKAGLYRRTLEDKTKIETIINSLTDGLMVIDQEARLVLANPFVVRLMGLQEPYHERYLREIISGSRHRIEFKDVSLRDALEKVLAGGESVKSEMHMATEPPIFFEVFWAPLVDTEGEVTGAVILLHDITDFVELDRLKSDFISIVSHELKTPLTSIMGFVRLLAAERVGPVTEKQRHYLDVVQRQSESLTLLINDLLDLSRIEAGMIDVRHEPVDLAQVVGGVIQQLENMAEEKKIVIHMEIAEDLPHISGDSERLGQVFTNLIHNAIKFTPQKGEVSVKAGVMGGDCLVRVSDNGIGISPQDLPRIFDKFYQVDSSSTRQESGTGLGLCICKQLVNAHGGELWASSTVGKGTTFTILLPLHRQDKASQARKTTDLNEVAMG